VTAAQSPGAQRHFFAAGQADLRPAATLLQARKRRILIRDSRV
jgi:hypothetical protein